MVAHRRRVAGVGQAVDCACNDSTYIGVDDGNPFAVREAGDRSSGVGADPGQAQEYVDIIGHNVSVLGSDHHGAFMQSLGSAWIAEFAPGAQDIGGTGRCRRRRRGPAGNPIHPDGRHPRDRSLLKHELTDQDLPGTHARPAPRKFASGSREPPDEILGWDGHGVRRPVRVHNTSHVEYQSCTGVDGTQAG